MGEVPIPVVVPSVVERACERLLLFARLRDRSWLQAAVSLHRDSRLDVANAVETAHGLQPSSPWLLYLEDDVIVSPRFDDIPRVLAQVDEDLGVKVGAVSFFRQRDDLSDGINLMSPSKLVLSQCVALRMPDPDEFYDFAVDWYAANPKHRLAADLLLGAWVGSQGRKLAHFVPSLVQHRELASVAGARGKPKLSASYVRAFGSLGSCDASGQEARSEAA